MAKTRNKLVLSILSMTLIGGVGVASSVNAAEDAPDGIAVSDLGAIATEAQDALEGRTSWMRDADGQVVGLQTQAASINGDACRSVLGNDDLPMYRFSGSNRYETSACVSYWSWPDHNDNDAPAESKAKVVVLARGDNFPDALAGGPLATYYEGPLLLTYPGVLPVVIEAEIERVLAPDGLIYILGGISSVSNDIRDDLEEAGYTTKRLAGSNRYETAVEIARELPDAGYFFFATGRNFPDALAAGNAAGYLSIGAKHSSDPRSRPAAVLLTQDDEVGDETADFVYDRADGTGVSGLFTAGGQADHAAAAEFGAGNLSARFDGSNRFDTTVQVSEAVFTDGSGELFGPGVGLATGLKFPDALAATPNLARDGQSLLLTLSDHPSDETIDFLEEHSGEPEGLSAEVNVFGGITTVGIEAADGAWLAYR